MATHSSLILASGSPRRRVLLRRAGFAFSVADPGLSETPLQDEQAQEMVARLAAEKAAVIAAAEPPSALILGADTAVVLDGEALGKPAGQEEAIEMLVRLGGREHSVVTGYALWRGRGDGPLVVDTVATRVEFRAISRDDAASYVATGEPLDKAGAYAVQGLGRRFVTAIRGSFTNVMGLPMETVTPLLEDHGVEPRRPAG